MPSEAFTEGQKAFTAGLPKTANPHRDTAKMNEWADGWWSTRRSRPVRHATIDLTIEGDPMAALDAVLDRGGAVISIAWRERHRASPVPAAAVVVV